MEAEIAEVNRTGRQGREGAHRDFGDLQGGILNTLHVFMGV